MVNGVKARDGLEHGSIDDGPVICPPEAWQGQPLGEKKEVEVPKLHNATLDWGRKRRN